MRMPISLVRALTEKASTAAMPMEAITSASRLKPPSSIAFSRRGPTLSSRTASSVITFSIGCSGAMDRTISRAAPERPVGSTSVRITSPPAGNAPCANGWNVTGSGGASRPPSFVSPTTPTTVRHSSEMPMKRSTSPVHATRRPIGSTSGKSRSASVLLRITTGCDVRHVTRSELAPLEQRDAGRAEVARVGGAILRPCGGSPSTSARASALISSWKPLDAQRHVRAHADHVHAGQRGELALHLARSAGATKAASGRREVHRHFHREHVLRVEPGSTAASSCIERTSSPAPESRITDTATCVTTSACCRRWRRVPPVAGARAARRESGAERSARRRRAARRRAAPRR